MFGLEMVEQSGKRLKKGTIYVTLGRMEDKGFIESRKEDPRPNARGLPRRLYQPSAYGVQVFQEWELSFSFQPKGSETKGIIAL